MSISETIFHEVMQSVEHRASHGIEGGHAFIFVRGQACPAGRAIEPSGDFLLKPPDKVARGAQIVVLVAPGVREPA